MRRAIRNQNVEISPKGVKEEIAVGEWKSMHAYTEYKVYPAKANPSLRRLIFAKRKDPKTFPSSLGTPYRIFSVYVMGT